MNTIGELEHLRDSETGHLPSVLDTDEVAGLLRISTWKLYRDVREDRLPPDLQPLPTGKPLRWSTASVLRFLDQTESTAGGT